MKLLRFFLTDRRKVILSTAVIFWNLLPRRLWRQRVSARSERFLANSRTRGP